MKLPSISQAYTNALTTFKRFPFVILTVLVGTTSSLILIEYEGANGPTVLIPILFGAVLGFPFLAGIALTAERWKWGTMRSAGAQLAGAVLLVLYAMTVPQDMSGTPAIHVLRLLMFTAGATLFAITVPFLKQRNELVYWNFCKTLFIRVITSGVFAVVLWAGLAIALAALDNLFGVEFHERLYGEMWVFINGVFSVWFFLAGVPKEMEGVDEDSEYPKGLQILAQYILVPLVFLYFIILYVYLGKIILAWSWPQGWVSRLILGFIATGIAAMMLVHPIKERPENSWLRTASRWFYLVIIPLTVMLFLAVWQRVSEYGITEGRYLGIAVVVWLVLFVSYFLFSKRKNILFITASLGAAVMLVSFGPWGMFSVSEKSQVNRLKDLLTEHHVLVDGMVRSSHDPVNSDASRQIISVIDYLSEFHGFEAIQPWFNEELKRDSTGKGDAYMDAASVAQLMGLKYSRVRYGAVDEMITFTADRNSAMNIGGYDRLLRAQRNSIGAAAEQSIDDGITYHFEHELNIMLVTIGKDAQPSGPVRIDIKSLCGTLIARYGNASADNIPPDQMAVTAEGGRVKVFLSTIRLERKEGIPRIIYLEAQIAYDIER